MSDLIDRQALLRQIDIDSDGEPGYYGDTWKFIDTIKRMPSALGTNLAEVGTDCISRQAAIDALARMMPRSYTPDGSHPADEEIFRAQEVFADCIEALEILPSAQPATNCSEFPNNSDTISRQAAIDALHMHLMYRMGTDSNKKRLDDWINGLPSAQPEIVRGCGEQKCYHPELKRTVKRMAGKNDGLEKKRIE